MIRSCLSNGGEEWMRPARVSGAGNPESFAARIIKSSPVTASLPAYALRASSTLAAASSLPSKARSSLSDSPAPLYLLTSLNPKRSSSSGDLYSLLISCPSSLNNSNLPSFSGVGDVITSVARVNSSADKSSKNLSVNPLLNCGLFDRNSSIPIGTLSTC